jgi:hypothetical protein
MAVIKVFTNGGLLLPGDLNSIATDYNASYLVYSNLIFESARLDAPASGGPYLLGPGFTGSGVAAAGESAGLSCFYLNPADYEQSSINKRTVKYRVLGFLATNAVAPAITFTVGLYPVSAVAGAEKVVSVTLGTVVSGSTVAFASPAKETLGQAYSTVITAPAAGYYALGVAVSGSAAAKSSVAVRAILQMHQE